MVNFSVQPFSLSKIKFPNFDSNRLCLQLNTVISDSSVNVCKDTYPNVVNNPFTKYTFCLIYHFIFTNLYFVY